MRKNGVLLSAMLALAIPAHATEFFPLPNLRWASESEAWGVSSDGSAVVGQSFFLDSANPAVRWTRCEGCAFGYQIEELGLLPGGDGNSNAVAVSEDGNAVAGYSASSLGGGQAFLWNAGQGMTPLGHLPGGSLYSHARDISSDGSTVVGAGNPWDAREAFYWNASEGMVGLGDLPGGDFFSEAWGVSGDGSAVIGYSETDLGNEAFLWTVEDGMIGLGDLPGGSYGSKATAISADGSTIIGRSWSSNGWENFRWTEASGLVGIGIAGSSSYPSDVSGDGSRIVGSGSAGAFLWEETAGFVDVAYYLSAYGIDLTGWELETANSISDDGSAVAGYGVNPRGHRQGWVVTGLPSVIPEPSTAVLVGLGLALMAARTRRNAV